MLALSGIKTRTAPTVQRLLDAGARFVGKTHHGRARLLDERQERPFRHAGERRRAGPDPGRLLVGLGRGGLERALRLRARHRHRRLGAGAGEPLRPVRHPPDPWPRQPRAAAIALAPSFDTCGYFARDGDTFVRVGEVLLGDDPRAAAGAPAPAPRRGRLRACSTSDGARGAGARASQRIEAQLGRGRDGRRRRRRASRPSTGPSATSRAGRPGRRTAR